ncbi:hypothetical protein QK342_10085 [Myroides odoratimimus]|uniref:hypothetical protein n=1 Tax=Myroides odoratimimus TaxID=76832 RepID=UPI0024BF2EFA|nr:hypothetical protein [Myroides odoratimimus]WHT72069.1 hypothetical protein QK342_10085 [Myroides odoratimimus]WHU36651.1 hypothetical protein QNM93_10070 [Myroides odoratimimus]
MKTREELQTKWYKKGEKYAKEINEMVAFGTEHGWDKWDGKEAEDTRGKLAEAVIELLREANANGTVDTFRQEFPPAHAPIVQMLDDNGSYIGDICSIAEDSVVFMQGTSYEERQAYIAKGTEVVALDKEIKSIGQSMRNLVYAIAYADKIVTRQGWEGEIIAEFTLDTLANIGITRLIPFNDGQKVLFISSEGIYLLNTKEEKLLFPILEEGEENNGLSMDHATLSHDNKYIVVGEQCSDHIVLDSEGNKVGSVGPQSEYPHYCLFTKDDKQLLTNSCHFYNGISIGVDGDKLDGMDIPGWDDHEDITILDEGMRVYVGVAFNDYYILGDAYGYIRAIHKDGRELWQHFLGSTISGMVLSEDEKTLYVGTYAGILHKLTLNKPVRDTHTIGTADIYEDFRLLLWKNENSVLVW